MSDEISNQKLLKLSQEVLQNKNLYFTSAICGGFLFLPQANIAMKILLWLGAILPLAGIALAAAVNLTMKGASTRQN